MQFLEVDEQIHNSYSLPDKRVIAIPAHRIKKLVADTGQNSDGQEWDVTEIHLDDGEIIRVLQTISEIKFRLCYPPLPD